jgi:hypothetical protein
MSQNDSMSKTFAQRYYLGLSDERISENMEWKRKDAALTWELAQIGQLGPNWREHLDAAAEAQQQQDGLGGGGGPEGGLGGGGGAPPTMGGAEIPEFGNPPEAGAPEGGEPPEAGSEEEAPPVEEPQTP